MGNVLFFAGDSGVSCTRAPIRNDAYPGLRILSMLALESIGQEEGASQI